MIDVRLDDHSAVVGYPGYDLPLLFIPCRIDDESIRIIGSIDQLRRWSESITAAIDHLANPPELARTAPAAHWSGD